MKFIEYLLKGIAIIFLGLFGGLAANYLIIKNAGSPVQVINKEEKFYIQENTALTQAVKNNKDSVIGVKTGNKVNGSGLILTSDGLAVTLAENMPLGSESNVLVQGQENSTYQVLKRDIKNNLALVKLDKTNLPTRGFFDLSNLQVGTRVLVLSQAYNYTEGYFFLSANEGIVKSFDDSIIKTNILDSGRTEGSPVFDIEGRVLGLAYKDGSNFINIIPVSTIKTFAGL